MSNYKGTRLRDQDWVKELARLASFTALEASAIKARCTGETTYGPDLVTRLKNTGGVTVVDMGPDVPGHRRRRYGLIIDDEKGGGGDA